MRKRTKNRKRPTARWGAAGAALLAGVCLAVQTQAARRPQEPSVSRCRPPCGGCRTATAPGRTPLPGKSASTTGWTLPVRKARRCWLSGKELPRLPDAATAMASACSCCTRTVPRPFMRTCNTCMCVPVKRYRPGRYWARQGRPAVPTGAHLHFELRRQGTACDPSALLGLSDA